MAQFIAGAPRKRKGRKTKSGRKLTAPFAPPVLAPLQLEFGDIDSENRPSNKKTAR